MSQVLVIAEHANDALAASTARTVRCATEIAEDVHVAVLGTAAGEIAEQAARLEGVAKVIAVETDAYPLAASLAPMIAELAGGFSHVLLPSSTFGKDVAPRVAAMLGVPQVSDIMAVRGPHAFQRPLYAGNVLAEVEAPANLPVVATARTASFKAVPAADQSAPVETQRLDVETPTHTRFVRVDAHEGDRPDLQSAPRVVSGGRALGSSENFELIFNFADALGAAVGASRAAVDAGYVPNDMQVGQTGKIIAPELYFAIGISGAIQHLTGIKDADTIVAINKDPDAPIFEIADYGLVGDLFEIVPQLTDALQRSE